MLQRHLGTLNESVIRPPPQLPHQLRTLRNPSRTQRMALGNQPTRRVHNDATTISDIALPHHLMRLAMLAQPQRIQRHHLIGAKAIVQLAHPHIPRRHARLLHRPPRRRLAHLIPDQIDRTPREQRRRIRRHRLSGHEDRTGPELRPARQERFTDDHGRRAAVGGRAALQLRERLVNGGAALDLLEGVDVAELAVGVVGAVQMVDPCDLREVAGLRAVFLHVLAAGVAEHLRGAGRIRDAPRDAHHLAARAGRVGAVLEEGLQGAREHLLEADDHHAVGLAVGDHLAGHVQARGPRGAVVVDVVDGDGGHAELVEDALAAGGVAVAVAGYAGFDVVVVDGGVEEGFDAGFEAEFMVVD